MITVENYKYFNLSAIETACNIPRGVLLQSVKGIRKLPTKHGDKLNEFLTSLIACNKIEQPTNKEVIKEDIKPAKQAKTGACVNIKDYKLLLSGKYQNIKTGDKVTLNKTDKGYFLA